MNIKASILNNAIKAQSEIRKLEKLMNQSNSENEIENTQSPSDNPAKDFLKNDKVNFHIRSYTGKPRARHHQINQQFQIRFNPVIQESNRLMSTRKIKPSKLKTKEEMSVLKYLEDKKRLKSSKCMYFIPPPIDQRIDYLTLKEESEKRQEALRNHLKQNSNFSESLKKRYFELRQRIESNFLKSAEQTEQLKFNKIKKSNDDSSFYVAKSVFMKNKNKVSSKEDIEQLKIRLDKIIKPLKQIQSFKR